MITKNHELHIYTVSPQMHTDGMTGQRLAHRAYRVTETAGDPFNRDGSISGLSTHGRRLVISRLPFGSPEIMTRQDAARVLREWRTMPRYRWGRDRSAHLMTGQYVSA